MPVYALTHRNDKLKNCIVTSVSIKDPITGAVADTSGIWDTGATNSVITKKKAQELGLKPVSMARVLGVHGAKQVPVYLVTITLNNQNISLTTQVTECEELSGDGKEVGMLIGMNIINMGDFAISNYNGETFMTFRVPSLEQIDYVQEIAEFNRCLKIHNLNVSKKLSDKCACKSGKDFKNCHGNSVYAKAK